MMSGINLYRDYCWCWHSSTFPLEAIINQKKYCPPKVSTKNTFPILRQISGKICTANILEISFMQDNCIVMY